MQAVATANRRTDLGFTQTLAYTQLSWHKYPADKNCGMQSGLLATETEFFYLTFAELGAIYRIQFMALVLYQLYRA
jgi:hypothetical protein